MGRSGSPARVLFAVLFAAALATTVLVLASRTPDLVLEVRRLPDVITPNGDGLRDKAEITFFVREDEPHARVTLVGKDLVLVKTLDADAALEKDEAGHLRVGRDRRRRRDGAGGPLPPAGGAPGERPRHGLPAPGRPQPPAAA